MEFNLKFDEDKLREIVDEVVNKIRSGEIQLIEGPKGEWNPLSDVIPVVKGCYLTTTINYEVYCDYWNGENFDRTEDVIAWMPLPRPYMGKEQL